MARITVEDCIDKVTSRFELVLISSQRARKLHTGDAPTVDKENDKNTVIALREIADETMTINSLKEDLINEFQVYSSTENDEQDAEESLQSENANSENISKEDIQDEIKSHESDDNQNLEEQYEIKETEQLDQIDGEKDTEQPDQIDGENNIVSNTNEDKE